MISLGKLEDEALPIVQSLLLIAAIDREEIDLQPYEAHILAMHDALTLEAAKNPEMLTFPAYRLKCLNRVIRDEFNYRPDTSGYEDIQNIDFIRVIDRRAGIPVALGALYLELARRQKWEAEGLAFPGHFLLRLDDGAQRLIVDPYHEGEVLDAPGLRKLIKKVMGAKAELNANYYSTVTPRDVILRFCNNRKTRLIQQEDYQKALDLVMLEMAVAPKEPRLLFDAGMLCARLDQIQRAIAYMNEFIERSADKKTIAEAKEIIRGLQRVLQ